jgi:exosortase
MTFVLRTALFLAFCALVVAGNLPTLQALFEFSNQNATASYVLLIPLVTVALVYQERDSIFSDVRIDWPAALPFIVAGAALMGAGALGRPSMAADLPVRVAAIVLLWIGGFLLFYGHAAARRASFPLAFLLFTIPIPATLLAVAVQVLKQGSTEAVTALFTVTGQVYHRDGFVFSLPGVVIEIADECSGIRSSIGLLLTSLLAGHVFLIKAWTKSVLILAVLPMAILKNAIRIVSLTLLSIHVDPGFLTGQLHHEGGIVFFALALALTFPILVLLRSLELRRIRARPLPV